MFANDNKINKIIDGTKNKKNLIWNECLMPSKNSNFTIKLEIYG